MASKLMKNCSLSFIIRKMKIRVVRYNLVLVRRTYVLKLEIACVCRDVVSKELSFVVHGNATWFNLYRKQYKDFLKK